eukprot:1153421-Pelagomonas_calceolata.AAC.2
MDTPARERLRALRKSSPTSELGKERKGLHSCTCLRGQLNFSRKEASQSDLETKERKEKLRRQ